jgi:hypothetical protein
VPDRPPSSTRLEIADPLALRHYEADEPARPKQDHGEQQGTQDDRPDLLVVVGQDVAQHLDTDHADHRADQRADTAEQGVEHDLRREDDAEHVRLDETLVEGVEAAREPGDGAGQRKDDGLDELDSVAEEADPGFLLANSSQGEAELRADEKTGTSPISSAAGSTMKISVMPRSRAISATL